LRTLSRFNNTSLKSIAQQFLSKIQFFRYVWVVGMENILRWVNGCSLAR